MGFFIIKSRKYLDGAKDRSCVHCGARDGTVVAAHYSGFRASELGKGWAKKVHDVFVADLCSECHAAYDQNRMSHLDELHLRKIDQSEMFLMDVARTIVRRIGQGLLKVEGMS